MILIRALSIRTRRVTCYFRCYHWKSTISDVWTILFFSDRKTDLSKTWHGNMIMRVNLYEFNSKLKMSVVTPLRSFPALRKASNKGSKCNDLGLLIWATRITFTHIKRFGFTRPIKICQLEIIKWSIKRMKNVANFNCTEKQQTIALLFYVG